MCACALINSAHTNLHEQCVLCKTWLRQRWPHHWKAGCLFMCQCRLCVPARMSMTKSRKWKDEVTFIQILPLCGGGRHISTPWRAPILPSSVSLLSSSSLSLSDFLSCCPPSKSCSSLMENSKSNAVFLPMIARSSLQSSCFVSPSFSVYVFILQ